jgi:hypothetical protein
MNKKSGRIPSKDTMDIILNNIGITKEIFKEIVLELKECD